MKQWYCQRGEHRFGPASEEEFRAWIAEGRVHPDDFVWTEGMAEWVPASSVEGLFGPGMTPSGGGRTTAISRGGTDGQMGIFEIYSRAWSRLSGSWGVSIGFCLLIFLLYLASFLLYCFGGPFWFLIFLAGPFALSGCIFFLTLIRGGQLRVGMMWSGFRNYGPALGAFLLAYLLAVLWTLLGVLPGLILLAVTVVPSQIASEGSPDVGTRMAAVLVAYIGGIIMGYWAVIRYSQTLFLLADHPRMGVRNAIRRSIEMMRGHKWRLFGMLFVLGLIFSAVTLLTFGIGAIAMLIFGYPFLGACMAVFHDDLAPPAAQPFAGDLPGPSQDPVGTPEPFGPEGW